VFFEEGVSSYEQDAKVTDGQDGARWTRRGQKRYSENHGRKRMGGRLCLWKNLTGRRSIKSAVIKSANRERRGVGRQEVFE